MPLNATGQCLKVSLIVVLIILLVIEFFTLFVGLAFVVLPGVKRSLVHYGLFMVAVSGLLICLIFVGLCGAIRECYLKLFVFAGLMIAVLLVSLLVHLFMLPEEDDSGNGGNEGGGPSARKRAIAEPLDLRLFHMKLWDDTQRKYHCCGLNGPKYWTKMNMSIPFSCCHSFDNSSDPFFEHCHKSGYGDFLYTRACPNRFTQFPAYRGSIADNETSSNITMVTIIRTAGYFLQLFSVILAIWLGVLILLSYQCAYY